MGDYDRLLQAFTQKPVQYSSELIVDLGVSQASLFRLLAKSQAEGAIIRVGRGLYQQAEHYAQQDPWLAAQRLYPAGVLCLLSALAFHQLTTQSPSLVWVAVARNAWRKQASFPPIQPVHMSNKALLAGIELHPREGGNVRVYSVAKTVADCFKFRNRIGVDIAIEALREGWAAQKFNLTELNEMASVCRVQNIMRPYVEALTA